MGLDRVATRRWAVVVTLSLAAFSASCGEVERSDPQAQQDVDVATTGAGTTAIAPPTSMKDGPVDAVSAATSTSTPMHFVVTGFGRALPLRVSEREISGVTAISSRDGEVALATKDGDIMVFDTTGALRSQALGAHAAQIDGIEILRAGLVASAAEDGAVRVWDSSGPNAQFVSEFVPFDESAITEMASASDGGTIAVAGRNREISVLQVADSELVLVADRWGATGDVTALALSGSDDRWELVVGTSRGNVVLLSSDDANGLIETPVVDGGEPVTDLDLTSDDRRALVTAVGSRTWWNLGAWSVDRSEPVDVLAAALWGSPNGGDQLLVTASRRDRGTSVVLSVESESGSEEFPNPFTGLAGDASAIAMLDDGSGFVVADDWQAVIVPIARA